MIEKADQGKSKNMPINSALDNIPAIVLLLLSVGSAVFFIWIAMNRQLSALESVLIQFFTLGLGFIGSYLLGKKTAQATALDIIKPHARSSFRRILFLYNGLSRLAHAIENAQTNRESTYDVLDKLKAIVIEQIFTADDALEDWRDIVPQDVEEVESRLRDKNRAKKKGVVLDD